MDTELFDQRERVDDQIESSQFLKLQVEDLQKRLQEKENKLIEAEEIIRALNNEVQSLKKQLSFDKRKYQKWTSIGSCNARVTRVAQTLACNSLPPPALSCTFEPSPTNPFCSDITEGSTRGEDVVSQSESENWPMPLPAKTNEMQTVEKGGLVDTDLSHMPACMPSDPTGSVTDTERSPPQRPLKTLSVRLEDCRHKLGPGGVFFVQEKKLHGRQDEEVDKDDGNNEDDGNDEDDGNGQEEDENPDCEQNSICSSLSNPTDPSVSGSHTGRSPQQLTLKTLSVRLEDYRHKLGPDGICRPPERKNDEKDGPDEGSCNYNLEEDSFPAEAQTQEDWTGGHYSCSRCSRTFSRSILLNLHLKMHDIAPLQHSGDSGRQPHSKEKADELLYSCNHCNKTFSQSSYVQFHQRAHKKEMCSRESQQPSKDGQNTLQKSSYACDRCSKIFPQRNYLKLHQRIHRMPTKSSSHIKDAKKTIRDMDYPCDQCSKIFPQRNYLRLHQRIHRMPTKSSSHTQEAKKTIRDMDYPCDQCSKIFPQRNYLRLHQRIHRMPTKSSSHIKDAKKTIRDMDYPCDQCSKIFPQRNYLRLHQRIHRMPMKSSSHTQEAKKTIRDMDYPCDQCSKIFPQRNYLKLHQRIHRMPTKSSSHIKDAKKTIREMAYPCNECSKAFSQISYLRLHQRIHKMSTESSSSIKDARKTTRQRTYLCNQCSKTFSQINCLRQHQKMHKTSTESSDSGNSRKVSYPCDQCSKTFCQINYLRLHQRNHTVLSNDGHAREEKTTSKNTLLEGGTCEEVFSSRAVLSVHQRMHAKEKTHVGAARDETFATSSSLHAHQRRQSKTRTCGECGGSFLCLSRGKASACPGCKEARKLSLFGKLQQHLRLLAQEKPHRCSHCPLRFMTASGARNHEGSHAGERPSAYTRSDRKFKVQSRHVQSNASRQQDRKHTGENP